MSKTLPYCAKTARGNRFDFDFTLHPDTVSAVTVANLLDSTLAALDREISTLGEVGNGDVLQALAMALAVRTRMLPGNPTTLTNLSEGLLDSALRSEMKPGAGNLDDEQTQALH
ncbi:MAG: hypothetical protein AB8B93_18435 [Pseudomonadales bacterium]